MNKKTKVKLTLITFIIFCVMVYTDNVRAGTIYPIVFWLLFLWFSSDKKNEKREFDEVLRKEDFIKPEKLDFRK